MTITADQLESIMPRIPGTSALWIDAFNAAMAQFNINTLQRAAAFLAQVAFESTECTRLSENLNYSATRLMQVFPREFPTLTVANDYAGNPWKIADRTYAGRDGNGDEASGDGWKFHGRGLIQLTGRANYAACAQGIGDSMLLACPDRLLTKTGATLSAAWFFSMRGCNELADAGDFEAITRKINGAAEAGEVQRLAYYQKALGALNV